MRLWISCFVLLLVLAEIFQQLKALSVPLPVFIVAGGLLAIASNFEQVRQWTQKQTPQPKTVSSEPTEAIDAIDVTSYEVVDAPPDGGIRG
ncbi:hypothetical protein PN466_22670 [Roseofilum reptotaenium CS-1145]|uniref:Uncharacterized protein n=1 Tax=Roseofilum reptotaenium AO1-A TaxID=1925591 RepID=A0A1L9QTG4_9CYAN|nr:hypothetical protein [Roseofilum reptotaenium]MDB9519751.1 hypothetical protein [Roseofilum reptotaenium CS-1145]OJJ25916.1 hypothetical protein BI308_09285 [Roseofilum reptotaenium AO1-A]